MTKLGFRPAPASVRSPAQTSGGATAGPRVMMMVTELEDYTIAYANGVARHLPVLLAVPDRQYRHLKQWFDPSVDLRLMNWPRHRSIANLSLLAKLTAMAWRERPDVIHLLSNNTIWLNAAAPLWPAPIVTTVHDVQIHPGDTDTARLPRWATTAIVRQSRHLVVHGDGLRDQAAAAFGKKPENIHVLHHPSIQRYARIADRSDTSARRQGEFSVLLFGRIFAYKGLQTLVDAERCLGDRIPGLRVVVAGRGDDPFLLRDRMGDERRYRVIHRFIEDEEVASLFDAADLIVLPYVEASQSGVLNIAASFGKPVIVSDVGELRATVEGNGLGLVVPPSDPAELADAMVRLANNPEERRRLGARSLHWANHANSPEAIGAKAARLYAEIGRRGNG